MKIKLCMYICQIYSIHSKMIKILISEMYIFSFTGFRSLTFFFSYSVVKAIFYCSSLLPTVIKHNNASTLYTDMQIILWNIKNVKANVIKYFRFDLVLKHYLIKIFTHLYFILYFNSTFNLIFSILLLIYLEET